MTIQKLESMLRMPTMRGHEARRGLTMAAHAICSAFGCMPVNVKFSGSTSTASMSGCGAMTLADIDDDAVVTRQQFTQWTGYVVHELLHRRFTNFLYNDGRAYVHALHNAIEDAWIERKAIREGLLGNISGLLKTLADTLADQGMQMVSDWSDPSQYPFSLAIYCRGFAKRVPVCADLLPVWAEAERRIDACTGTKDTLEVARWVFDQLRLPPAQRDQPQRGEPGKDGDAGGDAKGGESGGDKAGDKGDKGDKAGEQGDAGEGSGGGDKPADAGQSKPSQVTNERRSLSVEPTMSGSKDADAHGGSYDDKAGLGSRPMLETEITHKQIAQVSGKLKFEVRKLFENTAQDEFVRGRRTGSVHVGALASVATGNIRPFKRRLEAEGIESAVVLLLDVSGSMWSAKRIGMAVASTIALGEVLTFAGVDVAVMAFGSYTVPVAGFGEPFKRTADTLRRIKSLYSTNDYFGIRYSHDMLLRHDAQRKVCFVLTDGEGDKKASSHQCRVGRNLGITTIGVGIQSNVGGVFGHEHSIRVDDMRSLATVALSKIKLAA